MTPESTRTISARKTAKFSDLAIVYGMTQRSVWHCFVTKDYGKIIRLCFIYYFRFNKALYAFIYWSPIHYRAGSQTMGLLVLLAATSTILGYNSTHIPDYLKPLSIVITPFLLLGRSKEDWYAFVCIDIQSPFLLVYGGFVFLSGLIHLLLIWLGKGNSSRSKRGNSYIVLWLSKHMKVNEYFICGVLEPLLFIGIALLLWLQCNDTYGAVFLGMATLSEALQQLLDEANRQHLSSQTHF
ncbi:hypothetical protein DVK85_01500 [Flavobacterium arcticum]|uniref:Uncharacterized protein n=1 Tax=Flavobacterium arcticum TaxID=1784713 RepID=A0A345H8R7_9FLAO|nr:hypothetical protein [Flavobacterium arcticum]AXG72977.1 hypothetical protein DVK85_01500 [Flavobacterium arcticum]KAF2510359.1 hypothetical protein E0W72_07705 [Flavobacterium arcticum]